MDRSAKIPDSKKILIKGAKVHNLKSLDVEIPRNKLIVVTGLSGSGKSSLAFDTLYAEGQRRYVESLSSYARQFLGRLNKPEVDYIKGIPPAIAIEQKVNTRNPRSTVGTSTEVYDYLKLLYARIGKTYSPVSGALVKRHTVTDVVNYALSFQEGAALLVMSPVLEPSLEKLDLLGKQGFARVEYNGEVKRIADIMELAPKMKAKDELFLVVDRISVSEDEDTVSRIADSVQTAFFEGNGTCCLKEMKEGRVKAFSNSFEADGVVFEEPSEHTFSFNNPVGACPTCEGYGKVLGIDEDLVVPNKSLSVYEDAIVCWKGEKMSWWKEKLVKSSLNFDFPIHTPYAELSEADRLLLWTGNKYFEGLNDFFAMLEAETYKIQYRVMLSRYRGKTVCPECKGSRLKKEANYIKVGGVPIVDLVLMPISELREFFGGLELDRADAKIAKRLLLEIANRLEFLFDVGLGYLTLNRLSATLSGGESQRINLATSLGSSLVGSLYILDEPSIGLHPRDTHLLIKVLRRLQQIGNTVLVVEHEEEIIRAADQIIDVGPLAGTHGGRLVYQGNINEPLAKGEGEESLTIKYLNGTEFIETPSIRRKWNNYILIKGARENNLKGVNAKFPLHVMTAVTGVSGSGKSTLVRSILYAALNQHVNGYGDRAGHFDEMSGDLHLLQAVEFVDQNPIGKSSRSNPVTYIKAFDEIRKLLSQQQQAQIMGFKPGHFSFNTEGGRCEECQGEGVIKVEMQFMADVYLQCDQCKGHRFKESVLEIKFDGKNVFDILEMTVDDSIEFFKSSKTSLANKIAEKLQPLSDVGLGYVKLGQPSNTLSGGESQRIKLASFLGKEQEKRQTVFIFDEPTTGLHFHDIKKLLAAFDALLDRGNSIIVIEHNQEVIKCADWIIDLGPEGGKNGGSIVFEGTPEELTQIPESFTGQFLKEKLSCLHS